MNHSALILLCCGLLAAIGCSASRSTERTSTADRPAAARLTSDEAVGIIRTLEREPLSAGAPEFRRQAFEWVSTAREVGDIDMNMAYLKGLDESDYAFKGELLMQYLFGLAAWRVTERSDTAGPTAQVEAGLRSMITAYRNIIGADAKLRDPFMERLDETRRLGRIREYIESIDREQR